MLYTREIQLATNTYPADIIHMPFPKCALLFTSHSCRPSTASLLIIPCLPIPMNNQWHSPTFCHLRRLVVHPTMNWISHFPGGAKIYLNSSRLKLQRFIIELQKVLASGHRHPPGSGCHGGGRGECFRAEAIGLAQTSES